MNRSGRNLKFATASVHQVFRSLNGLFNNFERDIARERPARNRHFDWAGGSLLWHLCGDLRIGDLGVGSGYSIEGYAAHAGQLASDDFDRVADFPDARHSLDKRGETHRHAVYSSIPAGARTAERGSVEDSIGGLKYRRLGAFAVTAAIAKAVLESYRTGRSHLEDRSRIPGSAIYLRTVEVAVGRLNQAIGIEEASAIKQCERTARSNLEGRAGGVAPAAKRRSIKIAVDSWNECGRWLGPVRAIFPAAEVMERGQFAARCDLEECARIFERIAGVFERSTTPLGSSIEIAVRSLHQCGR